MLRIARCRYCLLLPSTISCEPTNELLWISFCGTLIGQRGAAITINNKNLFSELISNDRAFEFSQFKSRLSFNEFQLKRFSRNSF